MESSTKEYIRFILDHIKQLWAENEALKSAIKSHRDPQTRRELQSVVQQLLENPYLQKQMDKKFDPHIEKIMKALDDQEAFSALLQTPTKGLPN